MTRKTLPDFQELFDAGALELQRAGIKRFSVCAVADTLNVQTDKLTALFDDGYSFVASIIRYMDARVASGLAQSDTPSEEPARDRLFEVLMARFDEIQAFRAPLLSMKEEVKRDPKLAALLAARLPGSMEMMLSLAGVLATGPRKRLQVAALCALWLRTVRVWMKDESEDMAKTMAALDKYLRDLEPVAKRLMR